jgi:hypothetical protein
MIATVEVVVAIALAAVTGLLVSRVGGRAFDSVAGAISQLVGGYRPDGWPAGVQEEDRDRPWGRAARRVTKATLPTMPRPSLTRVRPTVHTR